MKSVSACHKNMSKLLTFASKPVAFSFMSKLLVFTIQWMPLVKFVEQPLIQADSMFKKVIDICIARLGRRYCGLSVHQLASTFDGKLSSLYFNTVEDSDSNCKAN